MIFKKAILKEALLDSALGLPLACGISYLILLIAAFLDFKNLFWISVIQSFVLFIVSVIRKVALRMKFEKLDY